MLVESTTVHTMPTITHTFTDLKSFYTHLRSLRRTATEIRLRPPAFRALGRDVAPDVAGPAAAGAAAGFAGDDCASAGGAGAGEDVAEAVMLNTSPVPPIDLLFLVCPRPGGTAAPFANDWLRWCEWVGLSTVAMAASRIRLSQRSKVLRCWLTAPNVLHDGRLRGRSRSTRLRSGGRPARRAGRQRWQQDHMRGKYGRLYPSERCSMWSYAVCAVCAPVARACGRPRARGPAQGQHR